MVSRVAVGLKRKRTMWVMRIFEGFAKAGRLRLRDWRRVGDGDRKFLGNVDAVKVCWVVVGA